MHNSRTLRQSKSFTNVRAPLGTIALVIAAAIGVGGCGAGYTPTSAPPPTNLVSSNVNANGPYKVVLTSTSGNGTTNIYTDFTQTGTTLTGAGNTLVCPSTDSSQCEGGDASAISITPSGTISGANITMTISFPTTAGTETATMAGTATGTHLAGTYTDSLGGTGTWTASAVVTGLDGTYTGKFNSTSNPLLIAPTISMPLAEGRDFVLTATATMMNWPCISSVTLSGHAIGGAFSLSDTASEIHIIAVPTGNNFAFSYKFEPSAPSCAGDVGRGMVANQTPWDY
jgi:hypothetical protein